MTGALLTVADVARELGRSRWYVNQLVADGVLKTRRRPGGSRKFITRASLDAWITDGAPPPRPATPLYVIPAEVKVRRRAA